MPAETISPEHAASLVKSGMWLDYGATHCEPDVFDKALAKRKDELENIKIRSCLSMRTRAVIEEDPEGKHFHLFSWHFSAYERRKHDVGRCNYTPLNLGEVPDYYRRFLDPASPRSKSLIRENSEMTLLDLFTAISFVTPISVAMI